MSDSERSLWPPKTGPAEEGALVSPVKIKEQHKHQRQIAATPLMRIKLGWGQSDASARTASLHPKGDSGFNDLFQVNLTSGFCAAAIYTLAVMFYSLLIFWSSEHLTVAFVCKFSDENGS